MSKTKEEGHTPGPWKVTTGVHSETTDLYDYGDKWFNVNGEDGVIADILFGRCLTQDEEEAEANAILIARAPELLQLTSDLQRDNERLREALRKIIDCYGDFTEVRNTIDAALTPIEITIDKT